MRRFKLRDGCELQGFRVRLYPDADTVRQIRGVADATRRLWNWLVKQGEDQEQANAAWAVSTGAIELKPVRPDYIGLTSDQAAEAKCAHRKAVGEWYGRLRPVVADCPRRGLFASAKNAESWMTAHQVKWDYQMLRVVLRWLYPHDHAGYKIGASLLQSLVIDFYGSKGWKRFKRRHDRMPLRSRTGTCFEEGAFGARGSTHTNPKYGLPNPNYYNCQVKINGWTIKGRLPGKRPIEPIVDDDGAVVDDKRPVGRIVEGVSIVEEADGWYANIVLEVPIRESAPVIPGSSIGLDVGLDNLVAYSEPITIHTKDGEYTTEKIANPRGRELARTVAAYQANGWAVGRLHQRARRHNLHEIYTKVIKPLAQYETIKVELLTAKVGQLGSTKQSSMRTIVTLLKQRYGDRVREVDAAYTSQDCSNCGVRDKDAWSYGGAPVKICPHCSAALDRDINAARNVVARPALS